MGKEIKVSPYVQLIDLETNQVVDDFYIGKNDELVDYTYNRWDKDENPIEYKLVRRDGSFFLIIGGK